MNRKQRITPQIRIGIIGQRLYTLEFCKISGQGTHRQDAYVIWFISPIHILVYFLSTYPETHQSPAKRKVYIIIESAPTQFIFVILVENSWLREEFLQMLQDLPKRNCYDQSKNQTLLGDSLPTNQFNICSACMSVFT